MKSLVDKISDKIYGTIYSNISMPIDFYYDNLTSLPINMLLSPEDVAELHRIATSVLFMGNPSKRKKARNEVMERRGFIPWDGGTNRSIYIHAMTPNVVYKVALDPGGIEDNFSEYRNQFILKPYCAKTFEVTYCGTVISQEMVDAFKSKEQMCKYADGMLDIIKYKITPKYIMTDIGTSTFKNWGVRPGSFPIILDYTSIYELDGNKLICQKPLNNGKVCGGAIDYNDGFDFLICRKCGRKYSVNEVAKDKVANEDFIGDFIAGKGEDKMKISVVNAATGDVMCEHNLGGETDFFKNKKTSAPKEHRKTPSIGVKFIDAPCKAKTTSKKTADPIKKDNATVEKKESVVTKEDKKTPIQVAYQSININLKEAKPSGIITDEADTVKPFIVFTGLNEEAAKKEEVEEKKVEELPKSEDEALDIKEDLVDPVVEEAAPEEEKEEEAITSEDIMNVLSGNSEAPVEKEDEEATTVYSDTHEVEAPIAEEEKPAEETPVEEEKPKTIKKGKTTHRDSKGKFVKADDEEAIENMAPLMKQKVKKGKKSIADDLSKY